MVIEAVGVSDLSCGGYEGGMETRTGQNLEKRRHIRFEQRN